MHPKVKEIEDRRASADIPRSRVLARAEISSSTFARWKAGESPSLRKLDKFAEVLEDLIAERARDLEAEGFAGKASA